MTVLLKSSSFKASTQRTLATDFEFDATLGRAELVVFGNPGWLQTQGAGEQHPNFHIQGSTHRLDAY